jgi:hypothetical protein
MLLILVVQNISVEVMPFKLKPCNILNFGATVVPKPRT